MRGKVKSSAGKNLGENTLTAKEEKKDHCGSDGGLMHQSSTFR